ncbi:MAG: hypothetical protein AAF414_15920 [Pseudomonadota bacterium]
MRPSMIGAAARYAVLACSAAWLVAAIGRALSVAWYIIAVAVISCVVALTLRETKDVPPGQ